MQHIGALVMFFHRRIGGLFCRDCAMKYFREYSLKTLVLGWWGIISLFATPVVLLTNIANYLFRARSIAPVPAGAAAPTLTGEAIGRLNGVSALLIDRLNKGEKLDTVAPDIARQASVTPGQVVRYVQQLIAAQNQRGA
ncbi:MAG: hypothetical protein JSS20_17215 [Proteobacteria bacterium]|nr:hypothetical protein [Pseudomonadota bacterium]